MDDFMRELRKIPPVTRFLCFSSLAVTGTTLMNIVSSYKALYVRDLVLRRFEVWRLYTSFFLGGGGINYIFELVMLYRTATELEEGPYVRRSSDFAWQLFLANIATIIASTPLNPYIFARPMLVCLTYLSSQLAPAGAQSSLFGLVTFPVRYLPFVMIGLDLLMGGPGAAAQSCVGAAIGHLWWWGVWGASLGGQGYLSAFGEAPRWLRNLFGESGTRGGDGGFRMGVRVGHNWGSGRRLG
ncbi:Der1-like family-domain-containing protein [Schizophyllum amplum]|uniref:Derlin n=1 Tax=Schizophyllum amplum TaxID=97359 RepID=A0A550CC36_9AGAR|nr:Der1-like family-domain-containing protein [Auriculariopsis ampla]